MADSKATTRKKPVRKAPVQKDYPTKLDWLRAMTEYETKQAEATNLAKIARLDKRIDTKQALVEKFTAEVWELEEERRALVGEALELVPSEAQDETPSA